MLALFKSFFPQYLCFFLPTCSVMVALGTQVVGGFQRLKIGGFCTGSFYDIPKALRILQHGTGSEHIVIKGLAIMIGHHQRRLKGFK